MLQGYDNQLIWGPQNDKAFPRLLVSLLQATCDKIKFRSHALQISPGLAERAALSENVQVVFF